MNHLKSSLSTLSAAAVALGLAACGGSNQSQGNTPASEQATSPRGSNEYGSAMSQPGNPVTESGGATGTMPQQYSSPPPSTGGATGAGSSSTPGTGAQPSTENSNGQYGTSMGGSQYGPTGPMTGSQYGATNPMGPVADVSSLNDAQLAAVVAAIHEGEIQEAQLAANKGSSGEVKRFAHEMVNVHREMQARDGALLSRLQITPSDNAVSNQLKSDAQNEMSALETVRGHDFDRDYIDSQVRAHNKALELLDRIIPNIKSSEFRGQLQSARPKIEAHLREAEQVQQKLMKGTTNAQPGSHDMRPGSGGQNSPDLPDKTRYLR
jgi:putative membrane protein